MSVPVRLRRPAVILGVVLALLIGAATIRAAAAWTAASSPLVDRPPSVESLQSALATEQARSLALQAQLEAITAGSSDLAAALQAARDRIAQDAGSASLLQTDLEAARTRLAALERSIRQARAVTPAPVAAIPVAAVVPAGAEDREHERGDDD